jgi:O-antigen ligase
LGVLAAVLLAAVRQVRVWLQGLVVLLIVIAVLVAGARAGWVSLAVVLMYWTALQVRAHGKRLLPVLALTVAGSAGLAGVLYFNDAQFAGRVDRTLLLVQGDRAAVDTALAFRLPIWETAARMAWAHPLNGVGVRGFRDAYPAYASAEDRWVQQRADRSSGANHPHQLVLEVWCETGLIGLLLWLLAATRLFAGWRKADQAQRMLAWGPAIALVAMCFPINTHLAFYSSFWGTVLFWLLAVYCASIRAHSAATPLNRPAANN